MRIAYLCFDFGVPMFGTKGASVHVHETVQSLRNLGHDVVVYSPLPTDTGYCGDDFTALPVEEFATCVLDNLAREPVASSSHLPKEWRSLLYAEYVQKSLHPRLVDFRPDFIYERYSLFSYAGVELARSLGVPILLEVNSPLSLEQARHRNLVLARTAEELERLILNSADAVIVVSHALSDWVGELGVPPARIEVLPNGVNPQVMDPSAGRDKVHTRYGLTGKRVVGFVGSLKPWHDLDTLLDAVAQLHHRDERYHLLLVGDGPRMKQLQARNDPYVTWTGAVPYDEVPSYLAAADVVTVPLGAGRDCYFSPLKLYEAMAMAKPVIGARVGEVEAAIADRETGLLYEPADAQDLARRIEEVFQMPDRGAGLGASALRWVLANRTWDQNAQRITEIASSRLGVRPS